MSIRIARWLTLYMTGAAIAAEPFQLAREDGRGWVSPGKLAQRPAAILFWDTECAPCLQELAHLESIEAAFPGAVFIVASLSPRSETRRALARVALPGRVVRALAPAAPAGLLRKLGDSSGALPFSAFFTADGTLCARHFGALGAEVASSAATSCGAEANER